jgi:pimeloyl-ACP methyl ester carboxylesterase
MVTSEKVGNGPPAIVVSGGPGLSYSYMFQGLRFLGAYRTCCFFNQLGCGSNRENELVTADATADQLIELANQFGEPLEIVAHSWGAHLLLRAIKRSEPLAKRITRAILVTPMPTTYDKHVAAGAELRSRISDADWKMISGLMAEGSLEAGRQIMNLALSAYTGSRERKPSLPFEYSVATFKAVDASMGEFNMAGVLPSIKGRFSVVVGEDDYIRPQMIQDLIDNASEVALIRNAGHFPFAEQPSLFEGAVSALVCQA